MKVQVYFPTMSGALGAKISLGASFGVSQPIKVSPEQSRSIMLIVNVPEAGSKAAQVRALDRVVHIAGRYDGIIIEKATT
jgi:hypothetical protein